MKASIYYFTGTGNSKKIADICKRMLGNNNYAADVKKMTDSFPEETTNDISLWGFIYPVIALSAPRLVMKWLNTIPKPSRELSAFLITSKGSDHNQGWAIEDPMKIVNQKGINIIGTKSIHMPDNWITFHKSSSESNDNLLIEKAETEIKNFIESICHGNTVLEKFQWPQFGTIGSIIIKNVFRHIGIKRIWTHFKATSLCSSCGKCARICPTKSITMENKKPTWHKTCEQCMRCVSFCPQRAIIQFESIFHGSKNRRYHEPSFDPEKE